MLGKYSYLSSSMRGIVAAVAALVAHLALTTGGVAGAWPGGTDGWYYATKFPINCCLVRYIALHWCVTVFLIKVTWWHVEFMWWCQCNGKGPLCWLAAPLPGSWPHCCCWEAQPATELQPPPLAELCPVRSVSPGQCGLLPRRWLAASQGGFRRWSVYRSQVQGRTGGVQDTICTLQCMPSLLHPSPLWCSTPIICKVWKYALQHSAAYLHIYTAQHIYTISTATLINHGQTLMQNFPKFTFFTYIIISLY